MKSSSSASGADEDGYWPVTEILEESGSKYKVLWGGTDPDTGEPWPSTWVPKSDCTDRLVSKWRAKLKLRKEGTGTSGLASADGSSETTSKAGAKRKRQPNNLADSDAGCDNLVKTQSTENHNSKQESSLHSCKVGPPRGIPKKRSGVVSGSPPQDSEVDVPASGSGNVNGPSKATSNVAANRKRRRKDSADGCKGLVKAQSAKDFDGVKQEFSPGFHSMKVGPPRVAKKRSGIASGGYLLGEDAPGPRSASESVETVSKCLTDLKSKQKQSEEPIDGCDDPLAEDLEEVKAKFGKQYKQGLAAAASPNKVGPSLRVRKVQPGSTLVNDPSLPPPDQIPAPRVAPHEQRRSTSTSDFEPPLVKPTSPASRDMLWERPGLQQGSAAAESTGTNAGAKADQLQPERLRASNSSGTPDLRVLQLVAKVEEIKRLQCAISMNSNATMRLSMEVIEALSVFQKDSQQHGC